MVVSMAVGANFLASIGLLKTSVLLGSLCIDRKICGAYEKPIVAFVCLSFLFLMLQVPPFHKALITSPSPSHLVAVSPLPLTYIYITPTRF